MERLFQIMAVILGGVAAIFLFRGNSDWAFVSAVLGVVSFFLSIRVQLKSRLNEREQERLAAEREADMLGHAEDFEVADAEQYIEAERELETWKQ